jgi:hypothetical protein
MSRSTIARLWMLGCLPVLAVFAPPIWSQFVARAEFQRFHRAALREILRKENLDPAAVERVRKVLEPRSLSTNRLWDKNRAAVRLTEVLKQGDLGLKHDNGLFEVRRKPPVDVHPELFERTSLEFVDSLSSVIRRLSILDRLGPGRSTTIEQGQLQAYLMNSVKVTDHEQVAKSFDSKLRVEVKTLQQPTTLWRIYGGGSGPVGRYYFCCVMEGVSYDAQLWVDASGLATPPENLRKHLAGVTIPAGTTVLVGTVSDNFADKLGHLEKGGNTQIFIPHVQDFPFDEYRKVAESRQISLGPAPQFTKGNRLRPVSPSSRVEILRSEIVVQSDDRILRFRGPDSVRFRR